MSRDAERIAEILEDSGVEYAEVEFREGYWWYQTPTTVWTVLARTADEAIEAAKSMTEEHGLSPIERIQADFERRIETMFEQNAEA